LSLRPCLRRASAAQGQAGFGHKKGNYLCKKRTSTHLDERRENRRTVTVAFIRYITS